MSDMMDSLWDAWCILSLVGFSGFALTLGAYAGIYAGAKMLGPLRYEKDTTVRYVDED